MKLIVFSDSHGTLNYMRAAVQKEQPDMILHLGDRTRDAQSLSWDFPQLPLLSVRGNCDWEADDTPGERCFTVENVCILLCHGHLLGVKSSLLRASLAARQAKADVMVFGHTHIPFYEKSAELLMLNPGTCGGSGTHTYGLLTVRDGQASGEILTITPEEADQ